MGGRNGADGMTDVKAAALRTCLACTHAHTQQCAHSPVLAAMAVCWLAMAGLPMTKCFFKMTIGS